MKNKKNLPDECVELSDCVKDNNQIYIHHTIFIDDKFGNNKTAIAERPDKPTRTITNAFKLLRKVRKSEDEIWNIIVRLGRYKLDIPIPNNVTLLGSGQGTNIFGNIKVIGNASLIEFKLFSYTIPSIHVNIEEGIDNAVVFFTGLDINTMIKPNQNYQSPRVAIRVDSHALNSNIVIRNCRINLDFRKIEGGENKFILTSNSKVDVITSIIQAFGHNSAINTVFENKNAIIDIEKGNTVFIGSSNQLINPIIFYSSSSPNLFFLKDNRIKFSPVIVIPNPINKPSVSDIPNAVIYLLGKENAFMQSRNGISNIQNVDPNQQLIAFAASTTARINIQGLETQFGTSGGVAGIPEIPDIKENVSYQATFKGNLSQSGPTNGNSYVIQDDRSNYTVKKTDGYVIVTGSISGTMNLGPVHDSMAKGWTVYIENRNPSESINTTGIRYSDENDELINPIIYPLTLVILINRKPKSIEFFTDQSHWNYSWRPVSSPPPSIIT